MTEISDIPTLAFGAPFLGRWFAGEATSDTFRPSLSAPRADLGVALPDLGREPDEARLKWQAPTFGHLGYALSGPDTARETLLLQDADGGQLFDTPGLFIASFRLHDGVRSRLQTLWDALPPLTQDAASNDRPFPAIFSVALPTIAPDEIADMVSPRLSGGEVMERLGLDPVGDTRFPRLVRDFKAPAVFDGDIPGLGGAVPLDLTSAGTLLSIPKAPAARGVFHVHDADGIPLDPGMAASGLHALLSLHPGLLPLPGGGVPIPLPPPAALICDVDPGLFVHICHPAGGPLDPEAAVRLKIDMADGTSVEGTSLRDLPGAEATLRLQAGGSGSEAMIAGILPAGALLPEPDVARLEPPWPRDQLRLGVIAHERLLTGLGFEEERQEFPSSRIDVARADVQIGVTGAAFGQAVVECLDAGAGAIASERVDADFGAPPDDSAPGVLPPDLAPDDLRPALTLSLHHLRGTGRIDAELLRAQSVVATLILDANALPPAVTPPPPGTPARAFLHKMDPETGRLVYLPNGMGRWREVNGTLTLDLVLTDLPDFSTQAEAATLAFDILMPAPGRDVLLRDLRGTRPGFAPAPAITTLSSAPDVLAVETGQTGATVKQSAGQTVIAGAGTSTPSLVLPGTISDFADGTLARVLNSNHSVTHLPAPGMLPPLHDLAALSGAQVQEINTVFDQGGGLIGRHRGTVAAGNTTAVISTAPTVASMLSAAPLVEPFDTVRGAPALQIYASLDGPGAVGVAEALRGITTPDVQDLITSAPQITRPPAPADPAAQVAVLRTSGAGGEGSRMGAVLAPLDTTVILQDLEQMLDDLKTGAPAELQALIAVLEAAIAGQAHRARALHRRILAAQGSTEMFTALNIAFGNARRDIFIAAETYDDIVGAAADLQATLRDRLASNPTLRLIVLMPDRVAARDRFDPETSGDDGARRWIAPLKAQAPDRVTLLQSAGPLRSRLRGFGSFIAVDGIAAYLFAGGLSSWGLERNSSVGLAILGEALEDGRAHLIDQATRDLLAWFLGVDKSVLPKDWRDLKGRK